MDDFKVCIIPSKGAPINVHLEIRIQRKSCILEEKFRKSGLFRKSTSLKTHKNHMEFRPGNNQSEWQFLGEAENAIPYQHVTLYQHMQWKDFPLEYFTSACSKFSGKK